MANAQARPNTSGGPIPLCQICQRIPVRKGAGSRKVCRGCVNYCMKMAPEYWNDTAPRNYLMPRTADRVRWGL